MSLISADATPLTHALPGLCAARASITPGSFRSTAMPPFTPALPLWMCARRGVAEPKFANVRVTQTRCLPWFSRTLAVPVALPADGTSFEPFRVACSGRPANAFCALLAAFTQALNAFFFAPEACEGYSLPQAARERLRSAAALVGLPASVAFDTAAEAALMQCARLLLYAAVVVLPVHAARHLAPICAFVADSAGATASTRQLAAASARIAFPLITSPLGRSPPILRRSCLSG